ncbi:uncharacterized protein LOC143036150 [Oratosquilla oratoria]|uniref:uncharacterized protein LOC143036150 n=1 Tax=Oratosquilla oratoria TaxID=337810 RepID=UPI003F76187D
MEYLQWRDRLEIDESVKRFEYQEYEPYTGADLNNPGDIRINIQNQDEFLLPSRSYLYIEGALLKADKKSRFNLKEDKISLVNNGLMYLFSRVDYQLGNETIEGYSNPGHASTMKGLLTYPKQYPEGMSFIWCPDSGTGKTEDNYGFTQRRDILNDGSEQGNFCGIIPLSHMFGFCENYNKVMYGIRHQLILRRASTNANGILKSDAKNGGDDKVPDGEIVLTKISWRIPHLKPSDDYLVKLSYDIQSRVKLDINYLNRQCERIEMDNGHTQLDWRLNITAGAEKTRYIILGFQTDKEDKRLGTVLPSITAA